MDRHWRITALIALVIVVFARAATFGFINYDDDGYVTSNAYVLKGLAADSVQWAFTSLSRFYWHPLTWLSLMADVELFGVRPGAMHATNVVLHCAAACLVFLWLRSITGNEGRSLVVAALFAAHPLRVESVAWIAERKDVLSAVLIAATLLLYQRYVRQPSRGRYATMAAVFALACMAKPVAITVPILLLLLDFWPLKRHALLEKLPLLGIAIITAGLTYIGAGQMGAMDMLRPIPLTMRVQNAVWSLGEYLRQTFVPSGFAIVYPYPDSFPGLVFMIIGLAAFTAAAVWQRKQRPWILVGWLWFVIGLAPSLGIVQAGVQSRADRFTYIPHVGLFIAVVWIAAEFLPRRIHVAVATTAIAVCAFLANRQVLQWRDSETIFGQALRNTSDNWLAEHKYGLALLDRNDSAGAERHLRRAALLDPEDPHTRFHLGRVAASTQRHSEALAWFTEAVRLKPDHADAHFSRASMLAALGRSADAVEAFDRARQAGLIPEWEYQARMNSGVLLANSGRLAEAEAQFRAAAALKPDSVDARRNLARAQEELRHTMNGAPSAR